mgnify:CR=1 FL=1
MFEPKINSSEFSNMTERMDSVLPDFRKFRRFNLFRFPENLAHQDQVGSDILDQLHCIAFCEIKDKIGGLPTSGKEVSLHSMKARLTTYRISRLTIALVLTFAFAVSSCSSKTYPYKQHKKRKKCDCPSFSEAQPKHNLIAPQICYPWG